MHARIGRDDDCVVEIGRAQSLVLGTIEREIDHSIVDKIDRLSLGQQPAALVPKLSSIGNHRSMPCFWKKRWARTKLRIKILFCGPIIDDRDPLRHAGPVLELPLVLEHAQDRRLEIVSLDLPRATSISAQQAR